jgi:hypothetical protein
MAIVQRLAHPIAKITAQAVGRKHPDLLGLMKAWEQVLGPEWAARVTPIGWRQRRAGADTSIILDLAVAAGQGLIVQHELPVLLSRINSYFGHRAVAELKLKMLDTKPEASRKRRTVVASEPQAGIDDPELAAALGRLGAAIRESAKSR